MWLRWSISVWSHNLWLQNGKQKIRIEQNRFLFASSLRRDTAGLQSAEKQGTKNKPSKNSSWSGSKCLHPGNGDFLYWVSSESRSHSSNVALSYCFLLFAFHCASTAGVELQDLSPIWSHGRRVSHTLITGGGFQEQRGVFCNELPELLRWTHTNAQA